MNEHEARNAMRQLCGEELARYVDEEVTTFIIERVGDIAMEYFEQMKADIQEIIRTETIEFKNEMTDILSAYGSKRK